MNNNRTKVFLGNNVLLGFDNKKMISTPLNNNKKFINKKIKILIIVMCVILTFLALFSILFKYL
jgi:hypothetical protein